MKRSLLTWGAPEKSPYTPQTDIVAACVIGQKNLDPKVPLPYRTTAPDQNDAIAFIDEQHPRLRPHDQKQPTCVHRSTFGNTSQYTTLMKIGTATPQHPSSHLHRSSPRRKMHRHAADTFHHTQCPLYRLPAVVHAHHARHGEADVRGR